MEDLPSVPRASAAEFSKLNEVLEIIKSLQSSQDMDVHQFNKVVITPYSNSILKIGDQYIPLSQYSAESICKELRNHTYDEQYKSLLLTVKKTIINSPQIEPETGLHVQNLLRQTFWLASTVDAYKQLITRYIETPNQDKLIFGICENYLGGGGCYAGIAGRLFREYVYFLNEYLVLGKL